MRADACLLGWRKRGVTRSPSVRITSALRFSKFAQVARSRKTNQAETKTPRLISRRGAVSYPYASTSVVIKYVLRSDRAQIGRRGLSGLAVGYQVERDFLTLVEAIHPGAFDSADVDEYVLAAIIRLDEAVAFLAVEPLYGSLRHVILLSKCVYERSRF